MAVGGPLCGGRALRDYGGLEITPNGGGNVQRSACARPDKPRASRPYRRQPPMRRARLSRWSRRPSHSSWVAEGCNRSARSFG